MPLEENKDYRPEFTKFLEDLSSSTNPNNKHCPVTLCIVKRINQQMVENHNTMSKGHFEAAKMSILRGDFVTKFMYEENLHVLKSQGEGWVYDSGKFAHQALRGAIIVKDGTVLVSDKARKFVEDLIR